MSPEGADMKVFDGFASPRWSEAEPGVGCKKIRGPRGANKNLSPGTASPSSPIPREEGIAFQGCHAPGED